MGRRRSLSSTLSPSHRSPRFQFFFIPWFPLLVPYNTKRLLPIVTVKINRLRVVPQFSSGIVEQAERERAWKSPHVRKGDTRRRLENNSACFCAPFDGKLDVRIFQAPNKCVACFVPFAVYIVWCKSSWSWHWLACARLSDSIVRTY